MRLAAPVPGALARSGKKRAVFAFANKREPELFPAGEAGRAAPSFPPPRRFCPPRGVPSLLCRSLLGHWRPATGGTERLRAVASRAAVCEGAALGLCACRPPSCSSGLRDLGATSGGGRRELSPHLRSPQPRRMQRWASVRFRGRLSARVVSFVYTLEDT